MGLAHRGVSVAALESVAFLMIAFVPSLRRVRGASLIWPEPALHQHCVNWATMTHQARNNMDWRLDWLFCLAHFWAVSLITIRVC